MTAAAAAAGVTAAVVFVINYPMHQPLAVAVAHHLVPPHQHGITPLSSMACLQAFEQSANCEYLAAADTSQRLAGTLQLMFCSLTLHKA